MSSDSPFESEDEPNPEGPFIHEMFQNMRSDIHSHCQAMQDQLHVRIDHLSKVIWQGYANLLDAASPKLRGAVIRDFQASGIAPPVRLTRRPAHEVMFGYDRPNSNDTQLDDYL
jgi:hypothetical protein